MTAEAVAEVLAWEEFAEATSTIAVRELCEFAAKRGDLDLRFTPSPTSQEGIDGHNQVSARRGAGAEREVPLQSRYRSLAIKGRADGVAATTPVTVEEVKTYRGDLARMPENHRSLHWAQLRIYGAQLCAERQLDAVQLALVYFHVDTHRETVLSEDWTAEALQTFHDTAAQTYLDWETQQQAHRAARNAALTTIAFPHARFHGGQRQLAEAVYRASKQRRHLMAQAPTGIGKSIGTLFPALKAMAAGHIDKVFYLTAKTSGRAMALHAIASLQATSDPPPSIPPSLTSPRPQSLPLPLRTLELVAREKSCVYPDKACHGDSCPLAKGFYDRLPAARAEATAANTILMQSTLREIALSHKVCPYYLSQELVRWTDVVVGDYNYYFDQSALLYSLTVLNEWRVSVLVDEAHNLVERGRAMYSTSLDPAAIRLAKSGAPAAIQRSLRRLMTAWNKATRDQIEDYRTVPAPPELIVDALKKVASDLGIHFNEHPEQANGPLQRLYFDVLVFLQLKDTFGAHSLCDIQLGSAPKHGATRDATVSLRNVVPAPFLKPRIEAAASTALFSATLNPVHFYRDLLGLSALTQWLDVPSPFRAEQLTVQIIDRISTRYADRARSVAPIAELILTQFNKRPGNYLAFFSSFQYLQQVVAEVMQRALQVPVWLQESNMSEARRSAFLERFVEGGQGIGFAVLGGVFAEGVDLPGGRLIGAFVATLGLPQINPVNEEMRQRMQQLFGAGYDYAYFYPGMRKVVQAAGRVIRNEHDQGVVFLIDDRFRQRQAMELLPAWWGTYTS